MRGAGLLVINCTHVVCVRV